MAVVSGLVTTLCTGDRVPKAITVIGRWNLSFGFREICGNLSRAIPAFHNRIAAKGSASDEAAAMSKPSGGRPEYQLALGRERILTESKSQHLHHFELPPRLALCVAEISQGAPETSSDMAAEVAVRAQSMDILPTTRTDPIGAPVSSSSTGRYMLPNAPFAHPKPPNIRDDTSLTLSMDISRSRFASVAVTGSDSPGRPKSKNLRGIFSVFKAFKKPKRQPSNRVSNSRSSSIDAATAPREDVTHNTPHTTSQEAPLQLTPQQCTTAPFGEADTSCLASPQPHMEQSHPIPQPSPAPTNTITTAPPAPAPRRPSRQTSRGTRSRTNTKAKDLPCRPFKRRAAMHTIVPPRSTSISPPREGEQTGDERTGVGADTRGGDEEVELAALEMYSSPGDAAPREEPNAAGLLGEAPLLLPPQSTEPVTSSTALLSPAEESLPSHHREPSQTSFCGCNRSTASMEVVQTGWGWWGAMNTSQPDPEEGEDGWELAEELDQVPSLVLRMPSRMSASPEPEEPRTANMLYPTSPTSHDGLSRGRAPSPMSPTLDLLLVSVSAPTLSLPSSSNAAPLPPLPSLVVPSGRFKDTKDFGESLRAERARSRSRPRQKSGVGEEIGVLEDHVMGRNGQIRFVVVEINDVATSTASAAAPAPRRAPTGKCRVDHSPTLPGRNTSNVEPGEKYAMLSSEQAHPSSAQLGPIGRTRRVGSLVRRWSSLSKGRGMVKVTRDKMERRANG
ncbi:hypothetical protein M427DRAFT_144828 [Gonapodya prolifera JEL478]|uniref:Uncharacterized protein n=1 Tax=Gonapodya prolifera (strain JEL478) TaxID=1344416 RepID=A0A139AID6_GONPJ|nr:hypothetical protein M427DRAFT_144828 [Gonapodya prolifera JEL478]|eukprot:KXS16550.1 hypothetical protein M427DRAFT_144828 [Gonapodya prolifera JEL478]